MFWLALRFNLTFRHKIGHRLSTGVIAAIPAEIRGSRKCSSCGVAIFNLIRDYLCYISKRLFLRLVRSLFQTWFLPSCRHRTLVLYFEAA